MARIRTIKPEFPHSESLGRVSRDARLLFVMLWTICDDEGRARANSRMLSSLLFPYDDDATQHIPEWLIELERENCIRVYAVDGNAYVHVVNWTVHQKIDRPSNSRLPAPPEKKNRRERHAAIREHSRDSHEASSGDLVPRTLDQGPESISAEVAPPVAVAPLPISPKRNSLNGSAGNFEAFYAAYPLRVKRRAAEKAYISALKRAPPDVILAGAKRYRDDPKRLAEPIKFTAHPTSWLNADCWLDETDGPPAEDATDRALRKIQEFRENGSENRGR